MKDKNIGIITLRKDTGIFLKNQLDNMLKQRIKISLYVLEEISEHIFLKDESVILFSGLEALNRSVEKISYSCEHIIANRTINHEMLYKILEIENGQNVFLVNDFKLAAQESINYLKMLGIDHINYVPYYPGAKAGKSITIAVTTGEFEYIPKHVEHIIDIGIRKLDISTIVEILIKIDCSIEEIGLVAAQYIKSIIDLTKSINNINKYNEYIKNKLEMIINSVNDGIVGIDEENKISIFNNTAEKFFSAEKENFLQKDIYSKNPNMQTLFKIFEASSQEDDNIIEINDKSIVISQSKVLHNEGDYEKIIILKDVTQIQNLEHNLRLKIMKTAHVAQYQFMDILGESEEIIKAKKMGLKISNFESPAVIYGETGTGKELFAQAIHLASPRRNNPFLAINFAAMSESLIESELFGYVDGAFTGAKKGGSAGIFEQAHGGTVFLDEIGDAPLNFQIKLLRVLQEKQVRRIGDNKTIPTNTRIIAATNKNILELINKGKFREDLYYRLNVLPLYLPALRDRNEDIILLAKSFYNEFSVSKIPFDVFIDPIKDIMLSYHWPGNARQLRNFIEYLCYTCDEENAMPKNLPPEMHGVLNHSQISDERLIELFMDEIKRCNKNNISAGRRSLAKAFDISENRANKIINLLKQKNLIEVNKGRKGIVLV